MLEISEVLVNYRFIEIKSEQSNCFSRNKRYFFKIISKKRGISFVFFAKNSALSRYLPLLDIYIGE